MNEQELDKKFVAQTETIMHGIEQLLNMQKTEILEKMETRISQSESKLLDGLVGKDELHALEARVAELES